MSLRVRIAKRLPGFCLEADFISEGGTLGLLGASGSGKTLTLSCIAGVARPDEGRIELNGRVLFDSAARVCLPPQQRRVGLLFQSYALFPTMTVERNILCGLRRVPGRAAKRARVLALAEALRLGPLLHRYPRELSGGEQQRVALARLWASEPALLLLDEPFSAVDEALKWRLESELTALLARLGAPALYVTHDVREARRLCDRVCVMDAGRSQPARPVEALFARPDTPAAARLTGCENIADAIVTGADALRVPDWGATLRMPDWGATLRWTAARADEAAASGSVEGQEPEGGQGLPSRAPVAEAADASPQCAAKPEGNAEERVRANGHGDGHGDDDPSPRRVPVAEAADDSPQCAAKPEGNAEERVRASGHGDGHGDDDPSPQCVPVAEAADASPQCAAKPEGNAEERVRANGHGDGHANGHPSPHRAPVAVAIRASEVRILATGGAAAPNALPCALERIAPEGDRRVAVCRPLAGGEPLRALLPSGAPFAAGDRVVLSLPPETLLPLYPAR